jgi:hypothetical protein
MKKTKKNKKRTKTHKKEQKTFFCPSSNPSRWSARSPVSHNPVKKIETNQSANRLLGRLSQQTAIL